MRTRQKIINLYEDNEIHAVKQVVSIGNEEDLNQFWEYIITHHHSINESDVYGFLVALYQLSTQFLEESDGTFFEIIVERSDTAFYFTVWNRNFVTYAQKLWDKRTIEYQSDDKRITVRHLKSELEEKASLRIQNDEHRIHALLASVQECAPEKPARPYDFIGKEDLKELIEMTEDLNEYLYEAQRIGFNPDVFIRMRSVFSMISMTLNYYPQIEEVAAVMSEFSVLIAQYRETIACMDTSQIALIEGFAHNFGRWLRVLFVEGGAELGFMNRSLRADLEMIREMIEPSSAVEALDLDAIFDF